MMMMMMMMMMMTTTMKTTMMMLRVIKKIILMMMMVMVVVMMMIVIIYSNENFGSVYFDICCHLQFECSNNFRWLEGFFSGTLPPRSVHKLRCHKQRFEQ